MNFKVGDRIQAAIDYPGGNSLILRGDYGTVLTNVNGRLRVRWDKYVHGHACGGRCENGHGWNVSASEMMLSDEFTETVDVSEFL